jgi:LiaI-LiaF-like transmembrane region
MAARAFSPEGLAIGICLVGVGVLWLLSNLGRIELLDTLRTWWPLSLIVWGSLDLASFYLGRLSGRS